MAAEGPEVAPAAEPPLAAQQQPPAAERQFIDLEELQRELDATKALLTTWAADTTKAAEECRRRHMQELRGLKGEVEGERRASGRGGGGGGGGARGGG